MYACKQCGTGNPLDSSFCKKCGTALPADDLAQERIKLAEMLDEGNNLFTEGRTDEAMLIAEAAVASNPSSHMAYSLKGLCHERLGQIADALECYETAVGLNADSSLDKVKVAALRNRLAQRVVETPEPNRRSAAMIGVAAAVLVLVGGSLAAIGMSGKKDAGKVASNSATNSAVTNPVQQSAIQQPPTSGQPGATTNPQPGTTQPPVSGSTGGTGGAERVYPDINLPQAPRGGQLPGPDLGYGLGNTPLTVEGPIGKPQVDANRNDRGGGDPPPEHLNDITRPAPQPTNNSSSPHENPGAINIVMGPTTPSRPGGSEDISDSNQVTALLKAAQTDYQLHKYESAAGAYTRVASQGGDSPRVQQRIGDCFRNLGNSVKARSAYNRAINMYQAQIKKGIDVDSNQRGLASCESALKVLGG